jgi:hypothetical protein
MCHLWYKETRSMSHPCSSCCPHGWGPIRWLSCVELFCAPLNHCFWTITLEGDSKDKSRKVFRFKFGKSNFENNPFFCVPFLILRYIDSFKEKYYATNKNTDNTKNNHQNRLMFNLWRMTEIYIPVQQKSMEEIVNLLIAHHSWQTLSSFFFLHWNHFSGKKSLLWIW